ncbi:hypothetical protein K3H43_00035 [Aeromonas veronii]|uniref:hypothetical protein n=1 Tax=Aeromonas veronii TaxID=654 RepID=UPI001F1F82AA|nr:hypothetical protein [Aeromonas veronii]MCF5725779.1 hypothetical protein [Aeromonas veronii]
MKKIVTSYQFNMFVKSMPITPSPDMVGRLFTELGALGLFPGIGNEIGPNGQQIQFFRLATHDDKISINFNTFALCISYNDLDSKDSSVALAFVEQAYQALNKLGVVFFGNRLSIVVNKVNDVEKHEVDVHLNKFITDKIRADECIEWDSRAVVRKKMGISNEIVNIVNAVRFTKASIPTVNAGRPFDAVLFDYDINTLLESDAYRFDTNNAIEVFSEMLGFIGENVFEQVWNGN